MKRVILVLSALVLLAAVDVPPAQVTPTFLDTLEVRLTSLDVVVTDRHSAPVHGLTQADFEVRDDNRAQQITNFAEYSGSAAASLTAAGKSEPAAPAPPRRFIFVVDEMVLHPDTRKELLENVGTFMRTSMRPGDQAMIVTPDATDDKLVLDFSTDREAVEARLDAYIRSQTFRTDALTEKEEFFRKTLRSGGRGFESSVAEGPYRDRVIRRVTTTLRTVLGFVSGMGQAPGRKVVVLVTTSLSSRPGYDRPYPPSWSNIRLVKASFYGTESLDAAVERAGRHSEVDLRPMIQELGAVASANGVTIYAIQPNVGFRISPPGARADGQGANTFPLTDAQRQALEGTEDTLTSLTSATGGQYFLGQDEIGHAFSQLSRDVDTYYSVAYRTPPEKNGAIHRIAVSVKGHPDYVVRTRRELMQRSPEREMDEQTALALFEPPAIDELGVTANAAAPIRDRRTGGYKVDVALEVPIDKLTFLPAGHDKVQASFSVHYAAADAADYSTSVTRQATFALDAKDLDNAMRHSYTYTTTLVVSPGTARVAVGVVDDASKLSSFKRLTVEAK
jgi:VWFA-related protein